MKIALAHKRLDFIGGTERDFYITAKGLRDLGHEVHMFCGEYRIPPPKGIHAHKVPYIQLGRTARLLSFAFFGPKSIHKYQFDIVLSFGRMLSQDILRSGGGSHRVFLKKMTHGGNTIKRLWYKLSLYHRSVLLVETFQFRLRSYNKILAVSEEVKREIISTYGISENLISVIYNGVDTDRFNPINRKMYREKIKTQWGIPIDSPLVLFVGSAFQRKGLERLLKLWKSNLQQTIYLLVLGEDAHWKRNHRGWLLTKNTNIRWVGHKENVEEYYGAADLLALPALQEAFGNVVLEALATGVPVLLSQTVGSSELLRGKLKEGILNNPDDFQELKYKISWMLNSLNWPSLSLESRKLAERFSWKNHFNQLVKFLAKISLDKNMSQ